MKNPANEPTPDALGPQGTFARLWTSPYVRAAVYLAVLALAGAVLWSLRGGYGFALQVGIVAFTIAYLLNPVVGALQRLRLSRGLSVVLVYLVLLQLIIFGSILLGQVVVELSRFVNLIPEAVSVLGRQFAGIGQWFEGILSALPASVGDFLDERLGLTPGEGDLAAEAQDRLAGILEAAFGNLLVFFENLLSGGPEALLSGATNLVSVTFQAFLILVASAYFLFDFPRFTQNAFRFVPAVARPVALNVSGMADRAVGGYLRGQILLTTILGVLIWVGLSLIGVPLATAISVLAAIFNLVPYLGPIVGTIPAVLLGLTVSPWAAVGALVVFVIANQLEAHVLGPMILSRAVDVHPVTVLLAITAGFGLAGILGALLAVPFVALGKELLEAYVLNRPAFTPREDAATGENGDPPDDGPDAGTQNSDADRTADGEAGGDVNEPA